MESGKRSKNFTEREKMLLFEVAKEFLTIIDNKKTDGTSVEAKKQAWMALTNKYNAASETGNRTEKQLHALYDNLKKKARKNMSDDKTYNTGSGTFCPKITTVDEKVVALWTPQFKPINNEFDSSAPYYNLDNEASTSQVPSQLTKEDFLAVLNAKEELVSDTQSTSNDVECAERPISPLVMDVESTPEIKKKNIVNISSSIIKRKNKKIINEDVIRAKRLEILEIQRQEALEKFEKTKTLLDIDIELKKVLLETAKLDLELKKKMFNL